MSGISSRIGTIAFAKQSAKGSPAASPAIRLMLNGAPSLAPVKERGRFAMTDSGRDQGPGFTSGMRVEGDIPVYLHPEAMASLLYYALGANADSGSTPNYTHTLTPAADLPFVTIWRQVGGVIFERFDDCKVNALRIEGQAGQPYTSTLSVLGISSTKLVSDPVLAALTSQPYIYPESGALLKIDTVDYRISAWQLAIDNGISGFQADAYTFADIDPGGRTVSASFQTRFTGLTDAPANYAGFYYDAGTTLSPVVGTHALDFKMERNANTSVQLQVPQVTYAAVPVQPDPGGAPIGLEIACEVEKPSGSPILTAVVKDQTASVS